MISEANKQFLSWSEGVRVVVLSTLFALVPALTRKIVGAEGDCIEDRSWGTWGEWDIISGAFVVNLVTVGMFLSMYEVCLAATAFILSPLT